MLSSSSTQGYKGVYNINEFPIDNLGFQDLNSLKFVPNEIFPEKTKEKKIEKEVYLEEKKKIDSKRQAKSFRDFSKLSDQQAFDIIGLCSQSSSLEKFPTKLHKIVERCEMDGYSDIISWLPHGRAFKIHRKDEFVTRIMPNYFYLTKFSSFMRQLAIYGFYKSKRRADKGSFFNELFLRGRSNLCTGITRLSNAVKEKFTVENEPNFYKMPFMPLSSKVLVEAMKPRIVQYKVDDDASIGTIEYEYDMKQNNLVTNDTICEINFEINWKMIEKNENHNLSVILNTQRKLNAQRGERCIFSLAA